MSPIVERCPFPAHIGAVVHAQVIELTEVTLLTTMPMVVNFAAPIHTHATSVLVGVQPVLTQVPPKRWRSMIATRCPAAARRCASDGPAWPVPMMIASNWGMPVYSTPVEQP